MPGAITILPQRTVMHHVTQLKRELKVYLLDTLPLYLSAADGFAGDGYRTPPPFEIHTTDKKALGGAPSLELIATDSSNQKPGSAAQVYRHRIVVGVTVHGDDEETTSVWVERYIWAIRQMCRDTHLDPSRAPGASAMDSGGEQYTPLASRPSGLEQPFARGAFIELFITTVE